MDTTVTWEQMKLLELEARIDRIEEMLDMKPVGRQPDPVDYVIDVPDVSPSYASFGDNLARDSMKLYTMVTGQIQPPSSQVDKAIQDLSTVLDHYKTIDAAVPDGKRVFARWCTTQGKSGKTYSAVNTGWLGWWLDDIAPRPEKQELSPYERLFGAKP